jgi:hypothetical protein
LDLDLPDVQSKNAEASRRVLLHSIAGPKGSVLARWLERQPSTLYGELRPLIGPFPRLVMRISGPAALLEEAGRSLPPGEAHAEAVAVRLPGSAVQVLTSPGANRSSSQTSRVSFVFAEHAAPLLSNSSGRTHHC